MKRLYFLLAGLLLLSGVSSAADDKPIQENQLPQTARQFIKTNFPKAKVLFASVDNELLSKSYDVVLSDGVKIEFDGNGNWIEVDSKREPLPLSFVPQQIRSMLAAKHPNDALMEIDRDKKGYDVKLASGMEIKFDTKFKVRGYDY